MLDTSKEMSAYVLATAILCGISYVHAASKGQRVLSSPDIPETQFTCVGRPPGYYADLETGCQVYHMCTEGGNQFSYRCPNTTLFQQRMLICAHWYQVNCSRSEQHYGANLLIGQKDKPFVDDLNFSSQGGKQLKTLQNPDSLQNLGHPAKEKQSKSPSGNENIQGNGAFQNNFKRDGESSFGFAGKPTPLATSYPTTSIPIRTTEDLSSLPLAGSVLPGGLKSFNLAHSSDRSQPFQSNIPTQKPSTERSQFGFSSFVPDQRPSQPVSFTPITTPKSTSQKNFVTSTKSPVRFSTQFNGNPNSFQPIAFNTPPTSGNVFQPATSNAEINLNFQPPNNNKLDLTVASQENAFTSRFSTTPPPSFEISGESIPETDVKAVIEPTKNGSLPDDKYNTFIKRFNPYEEEPSSTKVNVDAKEVEEVHHTFINRFVPSFGPSAPEDNREQQEEHVFINRFILTPEELQREKDRTNVNQLHEMLPPDNQLSVNFPNFDLSPPADDSDDSESNKIELHLQDSRRNLFIPDEGGNDFSKADAAPIVVTIPLHSVQRSPPMWFRIDKSDDPCGRCHPAFITNKDTCLPCVIIR